eukprot:1206757-Rhodomonas_salina.2
MSVSLFSHAYLTTVEVQHCTLLLECLKHKQAKCMRRADVPETHCNHAQRQLRDLAESKCQLEMQLPWNQVNFTSCLTQGTFLVAAGAYDPRSIRRSSNEVPRGAGRDAVGHLASTAGWDPGVSVHAPAFTAAFVS